MYEIMFSIYKLDTLEYDLEKLVLDSNRYIGISTKIMPSLKLITNINSLVLFPSFCY